VAAYRLDLERFPAPFGDPMADDRLAQDVAGSRSFTRNQHMARYLRARTAFFDRVLVGALNRDVTQVACVGAGYDGRSLRYAKPEVRFFEVDHPVTQVDKQRRLERLNLDASNIEFIALDLRSASVLAALLAHGWVPDANSLILCEGVAIYLEPGVLRALLEDIRALASVGTRLAVSLSLPVIAAGERKRLHAELAAIGEPARNPLSAQDAAGMLAETRWRAVDVSDRSRRAGLVVAAPVWQPTAAGGPPTASLVGRYLERLYHRRAIDGLPRHLANAHGIEVKGIRQLDIGVFLVERRDGPNWVARVFSDQRAAEASCGDAAILRFLEQVGFPAERLAVPEPVSSHEGQAVVVTEHAAGKAPPPTPPTFSRLGDLLGRLHTMNRLPSTATRPGGAWHHLVFQGTPIDELAACIELLEAAAARLPRSQRALYDTMLETASRTETCQELPEALIHPDFGPANAIVSAAGETTLIDWTGAGQGPRIWPLGFLLCAASASGPEAVHAAASAYRPHVRLEPTEIARLSGAIAARLVILSCWEFAAGRQRLPQAVDKLNRIRGDADKIATRALAAFLEP
jgi:methyltransferase (TIGR00027 family)